jgi:DNA-directed RNA polymerase subunit RPC12/RpoP
MLDLEIKKTECKICGKEIEGKALPVEIYTAHGLQLYKHEKGIVCKNCGTGYCGPDHRVELKFSSFVGYKGAKCQVCGEKLDSADILLDPECVIPKGVERAQKTLAQNETLARSEGKVCPNCNSAKVKVEFHRSMSPGSRIGIILAGVFFLIGGFYMNSSGSNINTIFVLLALLFGSALLWEGLTLLPIPYLNLKLIKINLSKEITCFDCGLKETKQVSSEK